MMKNKLRYSLAIFLIAAAISPGRIHAEETATPQADAALAELLEMTRAEVLAYKVLALHQIMDLTEPEAETFWPIYQDYQDELSSLQDKNLRLTTEFFQLTASGETGDDTWNPLARQWLANKKEQLGLWEKYQRQIRRKVSAYCAAQFLQVENQMRIALDVSLAREMPIITTVSREELLPEPTPPTREEAVLVTVTATVEAIDLDRREVTLKGPLGDETTFVVDERVKRLNEVEVGDTVRADYYISVAAELRAPTQEEMASPLIIMEDAGRVPPDAQPAGGALRLIKAVCTIEGLNRPEQTVTLQGPLGQLTTIRAAVPENLTQLRIGETVVVTYTEALALSLEKVGAGSE